MTRRRGARRIAEIAISSYQERSLRRIFLVAQSALKRHPVLGKLDEPIKGRIRDWSDLMRIESQALLKTMIDLKRNYQVPSYQVHDSLIVSGPRQIGQLGS